MAVKCPSPQLGYCRGASQGRKNLFGAMAPDEGSRAQASARFGLAHPGISGVVLGLAELSHLEEALAAAAMGPLPEDGIAGL
jgi:aryl-alcohol dehydrogenase-like predicted oxidoreductase